MEKTHITLPLETILSSNPKNQLEDFPDLQLQIAPVKLRKHLRDHSIDIAFQFYTLGKISLELQWGIKN